MQNFGPIYGKINKIDEKIDFLKNEKNEKDKGIAIIFLCFILLLMFFCYNSGYNSGLIKGTDISNKNIIYLTK